MPSVLEAAQAYRVDLLAGERQARADLALAYQHALRQAQADLMALQTKIAAARANGQTVGAAWLYREQRLSGLTSQLSDALSPYLASARLTAEQARALGLGKATEDAVKLLQLDPSVLADVVHLSPQAVEQLAGQLSDASPLTELLAAIKADALAEAKRALLVGVATGQSPLQMAKALANALDLAQWRAETITRTEALRAYREASRQTWLENADVVSDWIWFSALDRRTCAFCWSMHGTRHPLDEAMATHPNCLAAGAMVTGARVRGSTARWYEGEVIDIETVGGNRLTVTPNHPILTPQGWVAASLLHEGSNVLGSANPERLAAAVDPDKYQVPALIEDVAETCGSAPAVTTAGVPVAAEDFHGDGSGSEICVVRANSLLGYRLNAALTQPELQQYLGRRYAVAPGLTGGRASAESLQGVLRAATCGVGSFGVAATFLRRALGSQQPVGLDTPATRHAGLLQVPGNRAAGDAIGHRELQFRLAGHVAADQIVRIGRRPFQGHVYNLETSTGWYIANGIVTHNCRCAMVPETDHRLALKSGVERFASLSEPSQLAVLGKAKLAAYQAGDLSLEDLRGFATSPQWGRVGYERSLQSVLATKARAA